MRCATTCPSCDAMGWGTPGDLVLTCARCEETFSEQTAQVEKLWALAIEVRHCIWPDEGKPAGTSRELVRLAEQIDWREAPP